MIDKYSYSPVITSAMQSASGNPTQGFPSWMVDKYSYSPVITSVMNAAAGGAMGGVAGGGVPGSPGTLTGAPGVGGNAEYGQKPQVPDPAATQAGAIGGNIGNLAGLYGLGGDLNKWSNQQALQAYEANLPGYTANRALESGNVASHLAGNLSAGTKANLINMAAERGIATGTYGSPNSDAALLRALGLTTEALQSQGQQEFARQIANTPIGQQFNYNPFLVTPAQLQEWQNYANLISSAPDPALAGMNNMNMARLGQRTGLGATQTGTPWWYLQSKPAATRVVNPNTGMSVVPGHTPTSMSPSYGTKATGDDWYGSGSPAGTVIGSDNWSYDPYMSTGNSWLDPWGTNAPQIGEPNPLSVGFTPYDESNQVVPGEFIPGGAEGGSYGVSGGWGTPENPWYVNALSGAGQLGDTFNWLLGY